MHAAMQVVSEWRSSFDNGANTNSLTGHRRSTIVALANKVLQIQAKLTYATEQCFSYCFAT